MNEENPELNFLGKTWYMLQFLLILAVAGLVWLWALPGLAFERLLQKLGRENAWISFVVLTFWLGPLWIYSYLSSKPSNREVPKWARKKDTK